jgi:hypothetical protein
MTDPHETTRQPTTTSASEEAAKPCCSLSRQAVCCEPAHKASCCGPQPKAEVSALAACGCKP